MTQSLTNQNQFCWKGTPWAMGVLLLFLGCSSPPEAPEPSGPPHPGPHVILLSIDTLRADHLGSYGYHRPTSPHLDAFAQQARRYTEAFAPAPWTLPSHAAMLTGVHPFDLSLRHKDSILPQGAPSLAGEFVRGGYQMAAFVDSGAKGYVGAERGFDRGFEVFQHAPHPTDGSNSSRGQSARGQSARGQSARGDFKYDMRATVDAAHQWLENRDLQRPFFLFLHTKSVHAVPTGADCVVPNCPPYDQPPPYRNYFSTESQASLSWQAPDLGQGQEYLWSINRSILDKTVPSLEISTERIDALKAQYDAGIRFVDEEFGRLLDLLRELELDHNTVIAVTSDHGEAFMEHGLLMHQEVYRTTLRVPLLIRPIGDSAPAEIEQPVVLADIPPTLLREAGLDAPAAMTGRVLPTAILAREQLTNEQAQKEQAQKEQAQKEQAQKEQPPPELRRPLLAYYLFPPVFDYRAFSLLDGHRRLVYDNFQQRRVPQPRLYDSRQDPLEISPLSEENLELLGRLAELRQRLEKPPLFEAEHLSGRQPRDENLKSLGYVD